MELNGEDHCSLILYIHAPVRTSYMHVSRKRKEQREGREGKEGKGIERNGTERIRSL